MRWGAQLEWFEQLADAGKPLKPWLERVEVAPHLAETYAAFFDLHPGRTSHMGGAGYISAQEIDAYCRMIGIDDPADRLDFFRMIRAMDSVFLGYQEEMRTAADKSQPQKQA